MSWTYHESYHEYIMNTTNDYISYVSKTGYVSFSFISHHFLFRAVSGRWERALDFLLTEKCQANTMCSLALRRGVSPNLTNSIDPKQTFMVRYISLSSWWVNCWSLFHCCVSFSLVWPHLEWFLGLGIISNWPWISVKEKRIWESQGRFPRCCMPYDTCMSLSFLSTCLVVNVDWCSWDAKCQVTMLSWVAVRNRANGKRHWHFFSVEFSVIQPLGIHYRYCIMTRHGKTTCLTLTRDCLKIVKFLLNWS